MSHTSANDRWLLPRQQTELPSRELLPEAVVHRRREGTFLVLTAMVFVSMTAMLVLGASRAIDLVVIVHRLAPDVVLPRPMLVPIGALPFATSLIAIALAVELFGRRRASTMLFVGAVISVALVGLMHLADRIDGGRAMGSAVAFAACFVSAHLCHVIVCATWRRVSQGQRLARIVITSLLATAIGWGAFLFVLRYGGEELGATPVWAMNVALAIGAAACSAAAVIVLAIPAVVVVRALSIALRVGNDELLTDDSEPAWTRAPASSGIAVGSGPRRLPPALIVDDIDLAEPPPLRRAQAVPIPAYSSAEMRFFAEGDEA